MFLFGSLSQMTFLLTLAGLSEVIVLGKDKSSGISRDTRADVRKWYWQLAGFRSAGGMAHKPPVPYPGAIASNAAGGGCGGRAQSDEPGF